MMQAFENNPYNRKCLLCSFGICLWEIYCCDMSPYPNLIFSTLTSSVVIRHILFFCMTHIIAHP
ncbi:hypothetical protein ACB098_04G157100 [Castanea mollissima]